MIGNRFGFTLLIGILSLLTLCTVTFLLTQTISVAKHMSQIETANREDIWLFSQQLERELLSGSTLQLTDHSLTFDLNGEIIRYSLSGSRIIRQVQSQGFEIVLQEIKDVSFNKTGGLISMTITDNQGGISRWTFIPGIDT